MRFEANFAIRRDQQIKRHRDELHANTRCILAPYEALRIQPIAINQQAENSSALERRAEVQQSTHL